MLRIGKTQNGILTTAQNNYLFGNRLDLLRENMFSENVRTFCRLFVQI